MDDRTCHSHLRALLSSQKGSDPFAFHGISKRQPVIAKSEATKQSRRNNQFNMLPGLLRFARNDMFGILVKKKGSDPFAF